MKTKLQSAEHTIHRSLVIKCSVNTAPPFGSDLKVEADIAARACFMSCMTLVVSLSGRKVPKLNHPLHLQTGSCCSGCARANPARRCTATA